MALLVQIPLLAMLALINYLVLGVFHWSIWVAIGLSLFSLVAAWFYYLVYQAKHPDQWPPWDYGLPPETRMMNAFMPVLMIYILVILLVPVFQKARENALRKKQKQNVPALSRPQINE